MRCNFSTTDVPGLYRCSQCGREAKAKHGPERIYAACGPKRPTAETSIKSQIQLGSWLKFIFYWAGIKFLAEIYAKKILKRSSCGCDKRAADLDSWSNRVYIRIITFFRRLRK